ncbi:MAG TPA: hypothetical protein V6C76_11390 [Drouetiella sp.]
MTKLSGFLFTTLSLAVCAFQPVAAQPSSDPNLGHFYMARQQITITDDGPSVNDQRTNPAAAQSGGMPNRPVGLPRAGWQPYSQSVPQLRTSLPKTNNGVPEKAPPPPQPNPNALRARAGGLKPNKPKASQPSTPVVKAYSPYKQYEPDSAAAGSAAMNSNANVRGSVLHWARPKHSGY